MPACATRWRLPSNANGSRHDRDGEDAQLFAISAIDRRRAGAGAAAHAGGDEQHVGALDHLGDAVAVLHRRVAADLGLARRRPGPRVSVGAELQLRRARSSASAPARRCWRR